MYVKLLSMKTDLRAGSLYASALLFRFRPRDDRTLAATPANSTLLIKTCDPIYTICYDLSKDYLKFIIGLT